MFKSGAILDKITTLKDKTIKMTFESQELSPEQGAELMRMNQQFGWLVFAPENQEKIEIPKEPPQSFETAKTPSMRLRSVLFIWWKQTKPTDDFEDFYRKQMERLIEHFKGKLDSGE